MLESLNLMNFDDAIAEGIVLVNFWAPWCQACMDQDGELELLANDIQNLVKVAKVNVSDNMVLSNREGVKNIPLLILYKNGKAIDRFLGLSNREIMIRTITKQIENS